MELGLRQFTFDSNQRLDSRAPVKLAFSVPPPIDECAYSEHPSEALRRKAPRHGKRAGRTCCPIRLSNTGAASEFRAVRSCSREPAPATPCSDRFRSAPRLDRKSTRLN